MARGDGAQVEGKLSRASLEKTIPAGEQLVLDSSTLISYLEAADRASEVARIVLDDFVAGGRNEAIASVVTVTEVLVRPLRSRNEPAYRNVHDFLRFFPHFRLREPDFDIASEAARLRADYALRTVDALVVATALRLTVRHVITNDEQWLKRLEPLRTRVVIHYLESYLPLP